MTRTPLRLVRELRTLAAVDLVLSGIFAVVSLSVSTDTHRVTRQMGLAFVVIVAGMAPFLVRSYRSLRSRPTVPELERAEGGHTLLASLLWFLGPTTVVLVAALAFEAEHVAGLVAGVLGGSAFLIAALSIGVARTERARGQNLYRVERPRFWRWGCERFFVDRLDRSPW